MKIKLTEQQILQLAANAVNAASPVGMGMLHYQDKEYQPEDMRAYLSDHGLHIDYFEGRMTKLSVNQDENGWSFPEYGPHPEYQSWCHKYRTYEALVESVQDASK